MDRSGACYGSGTVIVTITDSCPCDYPNNAHSNRRWCCGDMYHMVSLLWLPTPRFSDSGCPEAAVDCLPAFRAQRAQHTVERFAAAINCSQPYAAVPLTRVLRSLLQ